MGRQIDLRGAVEVILRSRSVAAASFAKLRLLRLLPFVVAVWLGLGLLYGKVSIARYVGRMELIGSRCLELFLESGGADGCCRCKVAYFYLLPLGSPPPSSSVEFSRRRIFALFFWSSVAEDGE